MKIKRFKSEKKDNIIMDWLFGLGALVCGSSSLFLFVEQFFMLSLVSFTVAIFLASAFESKD